MDGNKDEALRCLQIARDSIESGDKSRALKFINKARRLHPSVEIDGILSDLNSSENDSSDATQAPSNSPKEPEKGPRRRVSANGQPASSSSADSPSLSAAYTHEQIKLVRDILRNKDYYDILGLEKSSSVEDVRKAYRKLSLKVHPDKNKAPGAEDAFKMVSKAFQCLSNEETRKTYDLNGSDEPVYETRSYRRGQGGMQGFSGFYDADIDAEEIFRNFFFGGMHPATTTPFGGFSFGPGGVGMRMGGGRGSNGFMRTLIQLLPVILILLLNFLPSQQPFYSFSQSSPYDYRSTTEKGVNFYVKSSKFELDYPRGSPQRVDIEQQVEHDYHSIIAHNCRLEMQQLHWGYRRQTPNCEALKRFEAAA